MSTKREVAPAANIQQISEFVRIFVRLSEPEKQKARELLEWFAAGEDPQTDPRKGDPWWAERVAPAQ